MARRARKIKIEQPATTEKRREEKQIKDRGGKTRKPAFFKVLLEGFKAGIEIPRNAVGSFGSEETLVTLKTKLGSWAVSINKTSTRTGGEGGLHLRGRGWADFVRDNAFRIGDFLVFFFKEDGDGVPFLDVLPMGETCCVIPPPKPKAKPKPKPKAKGKGKADAKSGPAAVHKTLTSHFEVTFKRFNLFGLFVPPEFVAETGMRRRTRVVVMDWEGREWPVIVGDLSNGGLRIGVGWAEFIKSNGLEIGATCLFQTSYLPDAAVAGDDVFVLLAQLVHF